MYNPWPIALTFDDILLIPGPSSVLPDQTNLTTTLTKATKECEAILLNTPIISSPMDTVTEYKMAIAQAQEGGIGIIHKNMSIDDQARQVALVKTFESGIVRNPVTVTAELSIQELINHNNNHRFSSIPILKDGALIGLVTNRDLRFAKDLTKNVTEIMTPVEKLITVNEGCSFTKAAELMHKHRIEKVLVLNEKQELTGIMTAKDIINAQKKPFATKDSLGRLRVGAAIGVTPESQTRAQALIQAGCDVIIIDTAHGHSQQVISSVKWFKQTYPHIPLIAGNVVTPEAALDLAAAGANAIKVGIGPGSICTTRVVAGVGMPQVTAIKNIATALANTDMPIIADGGIRYSGDITKAIAVGAWSIMIGNLFAGCEESPGDIELYQGRAYKTYRGMGSIQAMSGKHGSKDRYFQNKHNSSKKLVPEGIEGRVAFKGSVHNVMHQLIGGLRSGMGYTGCSNLTELRNYSHITRVSPSGFKEGHVHDVNITKEPPNYSVD